MRKKHFRIMYVYIKLTKLTCMTAAIKQSCLLICMTCKLPCVHELFSLQGCSQSVLALQFILNLEAVSVSPVV